MARSLDFPKQKMSLQEKPRVWPCPPRQGVGVMGMCGARQLDFQVLRSGPTWARHLGCRPSPVCHGRWSRPTCAEEYFPTGRETRAKQCWFGYLRSGTAPLSGRPEIEWPRAAGRASPQERLRSLGQILQFRENVFPAWFQPAPWPLGIGLVHLSLQ